MPRQPTLFVSHGAPNLVLHNSAARRFLDGFGRTLERPRAVLVASAHFETDRPALAADARPAMIYDFGGFEPELRRLVYAAPGAPDVADDALGLLAAAGIGADVITDRGFDHGTWVPLTLLFPEADIPVAQISVQPGRDAAHHYRVGRALAPLAEDGVLIVGSGAMTHNLHAFFRGGFAKGDPAPDWVRAFGEWMRGRLEAGAVEDVLAYRERAPHAADNHPTDEHLLPLFVALGAAGPGRRAERVHTSDDYGVLMMDAYRFG